MIIVKLFHPNSCEVFTECEVIAQSEKRIRFTGKGEDGFVIDIDTNTPYSVLTKSR